MKRENRQPTRREWAAVTSRKPVVRKFPRPKPKKEASDDRHRRSRSRLKPRRSFDKEYRPLAKSLRMDFPLGRRHHSVTASSRKPG